MAFYIDIAYTTDPPNKVNRAYTVINQTPVSISPLSTINQLNPVFVIDYNAAYLNANYVIVGFMNRKYNAVVSVDTAGRMVLTCQVDVLANNFSNCDITVTRNGGIGAPTYIPDNKLPILPNRETITSTIATNDYFSTGLENHAYLVTVLNGGTIT